MALLEIKNMNISVDAGGMEKRLVQDVSFEVSEGEILGLVGSSGSGKSLTSMAIARILSDDYKVTFEEALFMEKHLDLMSEKELCDIRGKEIAYVFQEPMTSLNPVVTIGKQAEEPLILHFGKTVTKEERRKTVIDALKDAGLDDPEGLLDTYPHRLSGGQRQRVMIAMAMITKPKLLVADEITTALDVDTRNRVIDLLKHYRETYGVSIIFISHDRKLVDNLADRVITISNGKILENAGLSEDDMPSPATNKGKTRQKRAGGLDKPVPEPVLTVKDMSFSYKDKNIFGKTEITPVLKNVNLTLFKGETLGIVGKSGSGKSTLVKVICGLQTADKGEVTIKEGYEDPQMVFQDPYSSLNPAKTIGKILKESLILGLKRKGIKPSDYTHTKSYGQAVMEMLKNVGLSSEIAFRRVRELSGGQRQRIAIATALISEPKIVILDEPVSAIDADLCDQVLELLSSLREKFGLSYIFISHDPEVINRTCDRVMVIEDGETKERKK